MIDIKQELMSIDGLVSFQNELLRPTLNSIQKVVSEVEDRFEKPIQTILGGHQVWRYKDPSLEHILIQRLYRQLGGIKSCYTLLVQGQTQEIGVLLRTVNEFQQDITFLLENYGKEMSENQKTFITEVLKEGYLDINLPWLSATLRAMVSRKKILASIGRSFGEFTNPSDGQKLNELDTDILSSFVHGAYPAIMDNYGHNQAKPGYQPFGVYSPRVNYTWAYQLIIYAERLIAGTVTVCNAFGFPDLVHKAYWVKKKFEIVAVKFGHDLSSLDLGSMQRLKKGKPIEKPRKKPKDSDEALE